MCANIDVVERYIVETMREPIGFFNIFRKEKDEQYASLGMFPRYLNSIYGVSVSILSIETHFKMSNLPLYCELNPRNISMIKIIERLGAKIDACSEKQSDRVVYKFSSYSDYAIKAGNLKNRYYYEQKK